MLWRSALTALMVAVPSVSFSLPNGGPSGQIGTAKVADFKSSHTVNSSCQTEVDGKLVQLRLGEGIHVGAEWRYCQSYDGHPVIIHSSEPPKSDRT